MASIIKKKSKYSTYYVIAERARVDGKPRIVKQWYPGTIDKIIQLAEGQPCREKPREIACQEDGTIRVLMGIAGELGLSDIINTHVRKRKQGMTPADYLIIAAINRAAGATPKSRIREWVDGTTLHLHMKTDSSRLESQNFWDHFDLFTPEKIDAIGDEIARRAIELEKIPLDCLVYDTTNYYNYWDVLNPSEIARMTKSKAGKDSLKHIGLALAVDRDWGLPLFHRLYPANEYDSRVFGRLLELFFKQISVSTSDKRSVTLVFDKGNNSEEVIARLDESRHHFVGCRSPYHHVDLCSVPVEIYEPTEIPDSDGGVYDMPAFETRLELYGRPRRIIVVYNEMTDIPQAASPDGAQSREGKAGTVLFQEKGEDGRRAFHAGFDP